MLPSLPTWVFPCCLWGFIPTALYFSCPLLLEQPRRAPALRPRPLLLPLPGKLTPWVSAQLAPSLFTPSLYCHPLRKVLPAHLVKAEHLALFFFPVLFTNWQVMDLMVCFVSSAYKLQESILLCSLHCPWFPTQCEAQRRHLSHICGVNSV